MVLSSGEAAEGRPKATYDEEAWRVVAGQILQQNRAQREMTQNNEAAACRAGIKAMLDQNPQPNEKPQTTELPPAA